MFSFIKDKLKKIYNQITSKISNIFSRTKIDEDTLKELEVILLSSDAGVQTTKQIIEKLREQFKKGKITEGQSLKEALEKILHEILNTKTSAKAPTSPLEQPQLEQPQLEQPQLEQPQTERHPGDSKEPTCPFDQAPTVAKRLWRARQDKLRPCGSLEKVYVMVGINGSGKTTFAAKLANKFKQKGHKVLLVAADTFRAAATEQLEAWATKIGVDIVTGSAEQDPASVVFKGCEKCKQEGYDKIIIDTAGRLQTKVNLMKELEKIKKIIKRHFPDENINTLLTIDSMLGQNSLEQAKVFQESTDVNGIILTKMDGTAKGGIVFAISQELNIPIAYISFGEQLDQFKTFDAKEYVSELLG